MKKKSNSLNVGINSSKTSEVVAVKAQSLVFDCLNLRYSYKCKSTADILGLKYRFEIYTRVESYAQLRIVVYIYILLALSYCKIYAILVMGMTCTRSYKSNFSIKLEFFLQNSTLASYLKKINTIKLFTQDLDSFYAAITDFRPLFNWIFFAAQSSLKNGYAEIQHSYSVTPLKIISFIGQGPNLVRAKWL